MGNINIDSVKQRTFDVIVIGSGMSGGWAAKDFTEKGLKTLVLERGRDVKHVVDYPTTNMAPYEFEHRIQLPLQVIKDNPVVSKAFAFNEDTQHFFVKDKHHPYIQEKPFDWIRGYQVGGKSLIWARQTQRWSEYDFEGPVRDGYAVDWPIRYKDLAPWYSRVEKFVGISGDQDGIDALPDGDFLPAFPLNIVENHFKKTLQKHYKDRHLISARCAHLSEPKDIHLKQGRGKCQNRVLCQRGCPFGGYFSSNSSTLPWAERTGNLTLKTNLVVHSIMYDEAKGKATGVKVIDSFSKEVTEYYAKIIFVNASTLNTNLILLNSKSRRFENGLGNDNGLLGKFIGFHNFGARVSAEYDGSPDYTIDGRNPANGAYMPRFRNLYKQETDFLRGYALGFSAKRRTKQETSSIGEDLKNSLLSKELGPWIIGSHMMGETIPKESNHVALDNNQNDDWDVPLLRVSVAYDDNDAKMKKDYFEQVTEMFTTAGFKNIKTIETGWNPGLDIHEMGGVRMGKDPKTSLLNEHNQLHKCKNVFVTDGACMTSTSTQNPSLTYMALTARAVDHAITELKKGNL